LLGFLEEEVNTGREMQRSSRENQQMYTVDRKRRKSLHATNTK
jgi:hypothetical protein